MITKQDILKDIKDHDKKSYNDKTPSWLEAYQNMKNLFEELNWRFWKKSQIKNNNTKRNTVTCLNQSD